MAILCKENVAKTWDARVKTRCMGKFTYPLFKQQIVVVLFIGQEWDVLEEGTSSHTANCEN